MFYPGISLVKIKTSNEHGSAGTSDDPLVKICSKTKAQSCCSFRPNNLLKDSLREYKDTALNNCTDFNHVGGIGQVTITSQGTDGWLGKYLKIYQDQTRTFCPIKQWVDNDPSPNEVTITLSCKTTTKLGNLKIQIKFQSFSISKMK